MKRIRIGKTAAKAIGRFPKDVVKELQYVFGRLELGHTLCAVQAEVLIDGRRDVKKKKSKKDLRDRHGSLVIESQENLSLAFDLPRSVTAELQFKHELMDKILELVAKQRVTHETLSKKVGTSRPKITNLLNNQGVGISIEFMIRVLSALGQQAHLKTKPIAS